MWSVSVHGQRLPGRHHRRRAGRRSIGWFMVLRRQSFAGHTLAVVGFPGAAGAASVGVSAPYGLLRLLRRRRPGDRRRAHARRRAVSRGARSSAPCRRSRSPAASSSSPLPGFLNGINALLFGSFLGITDGQVLRARGGYRGRLGSLAAIGRPLLFASVDPDVAAAGACRCAGSRIAVPGPARRSRSPRSARSPARCWSSRCSCCPPPPPRRSPPAPGSSQPRRGVGAGRHLVGLAVAYFSAVSDRFLGHHLAFGAYLAAGVLARSHPCVEATPRDRGMIALPPIAVAASSSGLGGLLGQPFHPQRLSGRHGHRRAPPGSSATSSCCAARCSPATRSATSRSPARWRRSPSASTSGLGLFVCTIAVGILMGTLGPPRPGRRRRDREASSPGSSVSGCCSSPLHDVDEHRHAPPASASCSVPSSGSAHSQAIVAASLPPSSWSPWCSSPDPCCSPASTPAWRRPRGARARPSASGSSPWWARAAAEATQAVGALLLLGLLAAPAGAAQQLTAGPSGPWRCPAVAVATCGSGSP